MTKFSVKEKLIPIFFFIQAAALFAQMPGEMVARAGGLTITKKEFIKRYEFTPHTKTGTAFDTATTKRDLLLTIVGEKLLAQAAKAEKIDRTHDFEIMMNYLRNIYLRDALYKVEVKDKIVLPDSELVKGRKRILKSIRTKFIFSPDEADIKKIYSDISSGASFDSLLESRPEKYEQTGSEEVTFGTMHPKLEEIIYDCLPGDVTKPVRLQEGWYICKVYSFTEKTFLDEKDKRDVEKIVTSRNEDKIYGEFYKKFFTGVNVNAGRNLFIELADAVSRYLDENAVLFREKRDNKFRLADKDISLIKETLPKASLDSVFIKFPAKPVSLSGFLDHLLLEGIEFQKIGRENIRSRLNSFIKTFIQNELLAREALRRGYDKLPDVADELKVWREFYLSRQMMKKIFSREPVTDEDAYKFFVKSKGLVPAEDQVKIAEILVGDLATAEKILNELDGGTEFRELAVRYTLRDSLRNKGGEFEFFPVSRNGELGKTAQRMKVGDVFGPVKTSEGYSIIKLLDKKNGEKIQFDKFEDAKAEIKNYLQTDKMYSKLNDLTAKMALDQGVEINENVLRSIKVTSINMIVFRRFGFGGQLVAAPYAPDFSGWFKVFEQMKKKLSL